MNTLLIIIALLVILLLTNKIVFAIAVFVAYIVSFRKENFIFNSDQTILTLDDKISFFETHDMTIADYEKENNVKIVIENDKYMEIPVAGETPEPTQKPSYVKYGDTVLLQSNAMEDRYLTGNRDGFNPTNPTGNNMEGVYTTNEANSLHEWIIMPTDDNKMNTYIRLGEPVLLQCNQKYLVGEQSRKALLYNPGDDKCGVYTQQNTSNSQWFMEEPPQAVTTPTQAITTTPQAVMTTQQAVTTTPQAVMTTPQAITTTPQAVTTTPQAVTTTVYLRYDTHIFIKNTTKYLSGARQYGYIDGETNQQVYTVDKTDGDYELMWIVKKQKDARIPMKDSIKLWADEPGLLHDDMKYFVSSGGQDSMFGTTDANFGTTDANFGIDDDIITANCIDKKFIMVNFRKEHNVKMGQVYTALNDKNKIIFAVKVAGSDGIFSDINDAFETDYLFDWYKNDSEVALKLTNDKYIRYNNYLEKSETDIEGKFIVRLQGENFYLLTSINNQKYILQNDNTDLDTKLVKYSDGDEIAETSLLNIEPTVDGNYKLKTIQNNYLFHSDLLKIELYDVDSDSQTDSFSWIDFNINRVIQYVKFYPIQMNSTDDCEMKLKFIDMNNDEEIEYDTKKAIMTTNNNIDMPPEIDGFYNMQKYDDISDGNTELNIDALEERLIKGGTLTTDINANTVYKFKIQIAGTNKIYTDIGTYEKKVEDNKIDFEIFKKCRYVKVIILECSNECKFKLEIY
jgi:hypothetical protein